MTGTRAALDKLLAALPGCQYARIDDNGMHFDQCRKRAMHGTASHQPTHCAAHTAMLGRGVVGTRTADWSEEVEAAEAALATPEEAPTVTIAVECTGHGYGDYSYFDVQVDGVTVAIKETSAGRMAQAVAEALGARVVRR